jgi:hypothetical protein
MDAERICEILMEMVKFQSGKTKLNPNSVTNRISSRQYINASSSTNKSVQL